MLGTTLDTHSLTHTMAQRKGGWGSFLGSAVSGLESRLDSILTDDDQASAKSRAAEAAEKQRLQVEQGG